MTGPLIPVSWGELFDKIAILALKAHRLREAQARQDVARELALLRQSASGARRIPELEAGLQAVNARLWRIEDRIREQEAAGTFGPTFIALARAVYRENDERGRIKQALNRLLHSPLTEHKQYAAYPVASGPKQPAAPTDVPPAKVQSSKEEHHDGPSGRRQPSQDP